MTQYTYTTHGLIDTMTDPLGRVTDYDYDALGRTTSITYAVGTAEEATLQYEYDAAGNLTAAIDENGNRTEYKYDALNRLVMMTAADPDGAGPLTSPVTEFDYDAAGNMIRRLDARGNESTYEYDTRDRATSWTDANQGVTRYEYDLSGNLTKLTDPLGLITQYVYDARNRLLETHDPDDGVTRYAYDVDDNLVELIDPSDNRTTFTYDARNRLVSERQFPSIDAEEADASTRTFVYDAADNLIQSTDRDGRVTNFAYDDLNRLTTETWAGGGNVVQFAYDNASNLVSARDNFSSLAFTHDARNRVKTVDNAGTPGAPHVMLAYAYDDANNVVSVSDTIGGAAAGVNQYVYDALHRLTRLTQSGAGVSAKRVDLAYNSLGQFAAIDRFADLAGSQPVAKSTYVYDTLNRLESLTHARAGTNLAFYNFTYDAASRITSLEDIDGLTTYTYDDRSQLTGAQHADPDNPDETYQYDANGNRISSHRHGQDYQTGIHNRLMSDGVYNYQYDAEGNLMRRTEIATDATREFTWDHRNRLTSVTDKDGADQVLQTVEFTYDALNRRISKSVTEAADVAVIHFVYDRDDVLLDFIDDDGAGPNAPALAQRYLHGSAVDQVLAQDDGAGNVLRMLSDHLGTVRDLVDNTGAVINHLKYDSYGAAIEQSNPAAATRYQFTGREFDAEIDLSYYRARYYDAALGRFVIQDPISFLAGTMNLYSYVGNAPLNAKDPFGLQQQPSTWNPPAGQPYTSPSGTTYTPSPNGGYDYSGPNGSGHIPPNGTQQIGPDTVHVSQDGTGTGITLTYGKNPNDPYGDKEKKERKPEPEGRTACKVRYKDKNGTEKTQSSKPEGFKPFTPQGNLPP